MSTSQDRVSVANHVWLLLHMYNRLTVILGRHAPPSNALDARCEGLGTVVPRVTRQCASFTIYKSQLGSVMTRGIPIAEALPEDTILDVNTAEYSTKIGAQLRFRPI